MCLRCTCTLEDCNLTPFHVNRGKYYQTKNSKNCRFGLYGAPILNSAEDIFESADNNESCENARHVLLLTFQYTMSSRGMISRERKSF